MEIGTITKVAMENLLALPIVTGLVMPSALMAVAAMPLGLEWLPLQVMGAGIGWVAGIAHWVAELPGAGVLVPGMSTIAVAGLGSRSSSPPATGPSSLIAGTLT